MIEELPDDIEQDELDDIEPVGDENQLYEHFQAYCKQTIPIVESGIFGADMQVQLCNDGPFTVFLDSKELKLH